jgi:histidyl-tRNA synthetase
MAKLQPVRGTHDLLPEDARRHRHIVDTALGMSERYGFGEIQTPIFEFTEVFKRTLGESSDVVSKEMYTFADNGGEQITLRPEGTASVARALISGGLSQSLPLKFFYQGPMFRYERPQKGRQRQFHQIGIELLGVAEPQADIEVLACGADILDAIGILEHTTLELNTLGDIESRKAYRAALVAYFSDHLEALSEDSRRRLEVNPLRILDSKNEGDRKLVADAPTFDDHLNAYSKDFFAQVTAGLDALGIAWSRNPRLVRGLDYYCHTAFEFTTTLLGSQGTVMGGGRYDGLVETMGGPAIPGVGWAAGIERLAMLGQELGTVTGEAPRPIAVVPMGAETEQQALTLAHQLRKAGFLIEHGYSGNIGKRLKRAGKVGARAAIILGSDELARGAVQLRDLDAGDQSEVSLTEIEERLARFR